jgi:uncharacterized protein YijF (DUF1287 family)
MLAERLATLSEIVKYCQLRPGVVCLAVFELHRDAMLAITETRQVYEPVGYEPVRMQLQFPGGGMLLFRCAMQRTKLLALRVHAYANLALESWADLEAHFLRMMLQPAG